MIVLDKFRGGRELVPGRELVHHHYDSCSPRQFGPIFNENSTSKLIPTKLTLFHIYACIIFIMYMGGHKDKRRGHGGRVVTLSPPTSEAGVRSPARPQVGKLVVA